MPIAAGEKIRASTVNALNLITGTYTPVISAAGGTPAVGADGYLVGKWWRSATFVSVIIDLLISGSGSSLGGTSYRITLPFQADMSLHVAGVLDAESDVIGNGQTRSGTGSQGLTISALLSGPSGTDNTGTALIFYKSGSVTSLGNADFTTTARIKAYAQYVADEDDL